MSETERRAAIHAAIRAELLADSGRSNGVIAGLVECDRDTVSRARKRMIQRGEIRRVPVRASDGRVYSYDRMVASLPPGVLIERLESISAYLSGPDFAATWHRTRRETQSKILDRLERLHRIGRNLKNRLPVGRSA